MTIEEKIDHNILLAPYTTFGIGGPADDFIVAKSVEELIAAVKWGREKKLPVFVLGRGANILIGDKGIRGLVIKNEAEKFQIKDTNNDTNKTVTLTAESGAIVGDLIAMTAEKGLSGFEHYAGIPSTVGGAIWQNLHFLGPDRKQTMFIADIVVSAQILTQENEVKEVDRNYFHFDYDWSEIHQTHDVVLTVTFTLIPKDRQEIEQQIEANLTWRNEKHPFEAWKKSAGSIFKVIKGYGAGRLIDQVGLKGKQIGGAEISSKHANFILNTGNATAKDVRALISLVQEKVKAQTGLLLEPEIGFVGEF